MADNYIEKRMDDYRKGTPSYRQRLTPTGRRPGEAVFSIPAKRVLVLVRNSDLGQSVIREFANVGCKVAFFCPDTVIGNKLAQQTCSRCLPVDTDDIPRLEGAVDSLFHDWGGIDVVISSSLNMPDEPLSNDNPLVPDGLLPTPKEFLHSLSSSLMPLYAVLRKCAVSKLESGREHSIHLIIIGRKPNPQSWLAAHIAGILGGINIQTDITNPGLPADVARECLWYAARQR